MAAKLPPGIASRQHVPRGATAPRTQYRVFIPDRSRRTAAGRVARITSPWLDTLAEARAWREERRPAARAPGGEDRTLTVGEACDGWLKASLSIGVDGRRPIRAQTGDRYRTTIENVIKPTMGLVKAWQLRSSEIRGWIEDQVLEGTRDETARALDILRRAFRYQVGMDALSFNPASEVKLARRDDDGDAGVVTDFMDPDTVASILETADGLAARGAVSDQAAGTGHAAQRRKAWARYRPMVYLLVFTGVRIGELLALTWGDVDLDGLSISIERSVDRYHRVGPVKTRTSRRTISIGRRMADMLAEMKAAKGSPGDDRFVFGGSAPDYAGNLSRRGWDVLMALCGLVGEAGAPLWSFHDARHFHASVLIDMGMDASEVAARLGHADATVTLKVYTHLFAARRGSSSRKAAEMLDARFGGGMMIQLEPIALAVIPN